MSASRSSLVLTMRRQLEFTLYSGLFPVYQPFSFSFCPYFIQTINEVSFTLLFSIMHFSIKMLFFLTHSFFTFCEDYVFFFIDNPNQFISWSKA